jgi:hypothetical protein
MCHGDPRRPSPGATVRRSHRRYEGLQRVEVRGIEPLASTVRLKIRRIPTDAHRHECLVRGTDRTLPDGRVRRRMCHGCAMELITSERAPPWSRAPSAGVNPNLVDCRSRRVGRVSRSGRGHRHHVTARSSARAPRSPPVVVLPRSRIGRNADAGAVRVHPNTSRPLPQSPPLRGTHTAVLRRPVRAVPANSIWCLSVWRTAWRTLGRLALQTRQHPLAEHIDQRKLRPSRVRKSFGAPMPRCSTKRAAARSRSATQRARCGSAR